MPKRPVFVPIGPSIAYVCLTRGYYAVIEVADIEFVGRFNWTALVTASGVYAVRRQDNRMVYMHRNLLDAPSDMEVDHANLSKLDNRRKGNLRLATSSQQKWNTARSRFNTSGCKGVCFDKRRGDYFVRVGFRGKVVFEKRFKTLEEAAAARHAAASVLHGEFYR